MKFGNIDHSKPVLTALKKAGFKVDEVVKQDKKTVITVSGNNEGNPVSPKEKVRKKEVAGNRGQ